ncbi:hypothetical protein [Pseudaminobacter salicylatoxidans]|uniref:hypothetical protein n=1 Tax=Pseudaminobacter salicylatoxidans TaxID=93369 RepID=UPI00031B3B95|nr:hypothetical protein [Pseudaminobacter salicylatoxidans]
MKHGTARQADLDRYRRKSAEMRQMIREAAEGMAVVGMDKVNTIPWEHVVSRMIWYNLPDRRSLTGKLLGDPIPERSALHQRGFLA